MSNDNATDFAFTPDLMRFMAAEFRPEPDAKGRPVLDWLTVFIRRDDVRAILPADAGGIIIVDTAGARFEADIPLDLEYGELYRIITTWRMGTTPA